MSFGDYQFPQKTPGLNRDTGQRGIASLHHPRVGTLRFRSNPKEFNWSYTLTKRIDQTYGGRVIQLLGTRIDDFSFKVDTGGLGGPVQGGWPYLEKVTKFMRDIMIEQRGGVPATFEYTTRGWKFNAYLTSMPFADAVEEVLREFEVGLKVQEDVNGLMSTSTLSAELNRLKLGIGFHRSKYNDPMLQGGAQVADPEGDPSGLLTSVANAGSALGAALTQNLNFLTQNVPTKAKINNVIDTSVKGNTGG